jgi:hypothetical protein
VRDEGISLALMECRDKNDPGGAVQILHIGTKSSAILMEPWVRHAPLGWIGMPTISENGE